MVGTKRKFLTLKQKIDIIYHADTYKTSTRQLAREFAVGKSQVADILKRKKELIKEFSVSANPGYKRKFVKAEGAAVDQIVFDWFSKARSKNMPVSGKTLQEKAMEVSRELNFNMKGSSGWLEKFLNRHNISLKPAVEDTPALDLSVVSNWREQMTNFNCEYSPRDIYSVDETGLLFRALPHETFSWRGEECDGGETAKDRLTVLLCTNMIGDKEKPIVIGNSKIPRLKKNCLDRMPVDWYYNKKSWITREIMTDWLNRFDREMQDQNRHVLLYLDNATAHPKLELSNVRLVFIPPSTTSECQPLNLGIIRGFKSHYRKSLIRRLLLSIENLESLKDLEKSINVFNALIWTAVAWKKVKRKTITNCFLKAGFGDDFDMQYSEGDEEDNLEDDSLISDVYKNIKFFSTDLSSYTNIDENLPTENPDISIQECVREFQDNCNRDKSMDSEEDEENNLNVTDVKDINEAYKKLKDIENFCLMTDLSIITNNISQAVMAVEEHILKNKFRNLNQNS